MTGQWKDQLRLLLRDRVAVGGLIVIMLFVGAALFAPWVAPYDPTELVAKTLLPPGPGHWLGTDEVGRDILSRVIYGARISLTVGLVSTAIGLTGGMVIGMIAGYYRGLDNLIMRVMDIMLAIPGILLAVAVVAVLGPGMYNVMIGVGVGAIPEFARLTRSVTLGIREQDFVQAAESMGASDLRILFTHIMRNVFPTIIVYGSQYLAGAILSASTLSFLGLGVQPPAAEWGAMVNQGRYFLRQSVYLSLFPSLAIFLIVMAFNLVGDALRDVLDPRLRGSL